MVFVEGKLDYHFLTNIFINSKHYSTSQIVDCWTIRGFTHYLRPIKTKTILKNGTEYLVVIEGMGKTQTIKQFLNLMKELLKNVSLVNKVLLVIDTDTSTAQNNVIFDKLKELGKGLGDCKISETKKRKYLFEANIKRKSSIQVKTGLLEFDPNLDFIVATFIKNHNVIPENLLSCDYDNILNNAVTHLGLNDFEGLCHYIFQNKSAEITEELKRISLDELLCKFI